jgi:hypothetical protein
MGLGFGNQVGSVSVGIAPLFAAALGLFAAAIGAQLISAHFRLEGFGHRSLSGADR